MAPNKYHCSSNQALELTLNTLRTTAFPALTSTTIRISQVTARPTRRLIPSIRRAKASKNFIAGFLEAGIEQAYAETAAHGNRSVRGRFFQPRLALPC